MKRASASYFAVVRGSTRGAAILEAALLLPVLVLLFAGIYDCFRAIQSYDTLSEIAQEAARFAARVATLEPGTYTTGPTGSATPPPGHLSVHDRIRGIVATKPWQAPVTDIEIVSQLQDDLGTGITGTLGPSDTTLAGIIMLRVTGHYKGLFTGWLFSNLSLQVTVAAPHL